ncbi:MAG: transglycosylase domain-containing protein [Microbacterium sp.]|uniref:transglycosylase domain-containing protein n=1 Tax=Microbacterium sp. TaxID=51671 RepID=UPI0039E4C8DE
MPDTKRTSGGVLGGLAGLVGLSAIAGVLITATVTPAIAVTGAAASGAITLFDNLPSVLEIDDLMEPTTLYYSDGSTVLATFYDQNRSPVTYDEIAPVMYDAILSSEDPRFYEHGGIDLIGTVRALFSNLSGGVTQGGSSISQQYVKNILIQQCEWNATTDEEDQECYTAATESSGIEGIERKLQEMRYAIALEQQYSKNEILLGYLNIANFGGTTYGIDAAARYYFGVTASQLSLAQAATLAGIVQNPNVYRIDLSGGTTTDSAGNAVNSAADGYSLTKQRQTYVLERMLDDGKITQEQYDEAVAEPITPNITPATQGCAAAGTAAYFCQYVVSVIKNDTAFGETSDDRLVALRRGGLQITTTLDKSLQDSAAATMSQYAPATVSGMSFGSASTNIETSTGRILSITQNTTFNESSSAGAGETSVVYAGDLTYGSSIGFPAGSTFKLFTLLDWLEEGHSVNEVVNGVNRVFSPFNNSCLANSTITNTTKINNFNNVSGSVSTPMYFTAQSINSGFLAMAQELDLCGIQNVIAALGVTTVEWNDDTQTYDVVPVVMENPSQVIGVNSVSPIAMAAAYAAVANNGVYCQPQAIDAVKDSDGNDQAIPTRTCTQAIPANIAATAAYALQGVMASGATGSSANPSDGTELIGKTGTNESYQTWMIESSTAVTTAVWVGNASGTESLFNKYYNGTLLSSLRYAIARNIQSTADVLYPGGTFPDPDSALTKTTYTDVPNVVGMTTEAATAALEAAGFSVTVGTAVDSTSAAGVIVSQSPSGQAAGGSTVTIVPSTGTAPAESTPSPTATTTSNNSNSNSNGNSGNSGGNR